MRAIRILDAILINGMVALGDLVMGLLKIAASLFWPLFWIAGVVTGLFVSPWLALVSFMCLAALLWRE